MEQLLIGDVHFGKYTNSTTWLESQLQFLNNDIIGLINREGDKLNKVIFLGDLFDVRYATNTLIGISAKQYITKLSNMFPTKDIYICAGNHDYYSPLEETKEYNAYNLVFGEEYTMCHTNVHIVWEKYEFIEEGVIIPWYDWENEETLLDILDKCKSGMTLYCHTDLENLNPDIENLIQRKGLTVMSGHIHYPKYKVLSKDSALYGLGACLPLDFSDTNSDRYVYICDGNKILLNYANHTTIQFKTYYDDEIFNIDESSLKNCKTRLCISGSKYNQAKYREQLQYIKTTFSDYDVTPQVVADDFEIQKTEGRVVTDINNYIEKNIPSHLKSKYNKVKEIINENK